MPLCFEFFRISASTLVKTWLRAVLQLFFSISVQNKVSIFTFPLFVFGFLWSRRFGFAVIAASNSVDQLLWRSLDSTLVQQFCCSTGTVSLGSPFNRIFDLLTDLWEFNQFSFVETQSCNYHASDNQFFLQPLPVRLFFRFCLPYSFEGIITVQLYIKAKSYH